MWIGFITLNGKIAGELQIKFSNTFTFLVKDCSSSFSSFASNLPTAVDKIWRIRVIKTSAIRILIHCNDAEVLNLVLSDSTCNINLWKSSWTMDITRIQFFYDTASDFYKKQTSPGRKYFNMIQRSFVKIVNNDM